MKKVLGVLLALVMAAGFGAFPCTEVTAETGNTGGHTAWDQSRGGIHKLAGMYAREGRPSTDDPKAKEVIIQFADPDSADVSKAEADKLATVSAMAESTAAAGGEAELEIADGITVQEDAVWEFGDARDPLTVAVATSDSLSTDTMIKKLKANKMVEAVSPNFARHICSDSGDAYREFQWALGPYPGIGVAHEWESGNTGSGESIVAVVDTGICSTHPDLAGKLWQNPYAGNKLKGTFGFDFINGDTNPEDDNGHGTHCAGIIGAATNADTPEKPGVQGVDQEIKLMALKVFDEEGGGYDSDIIAAFNYISKAMDLGSNVVAVNCSFGGEDSDDILDEVIETIGKKGAVTVCAAGNEAENNDRVPSYPANYDSDYIISVAATKRVPVGEGRWKADLVSFSNYGEETVDIAAPGADILSTVSYDCFNPTLYREENEQGIDTDLVQAYVDGSPESIGKFTLTNMDLENIEVISSEADAGFYSTTGLKIRFDAEKIQDKKKQKWQYVAIPYDLPPNFAIPDKYGHMEDDEVLGDVAHSMMIKTFDGPDAIGYGEYNDGTFSKVMLMDVPRSFLDEETEEGAAFLSTPGEKLLSDYANDYQIVAGNDDYWSHLKTDLLVQNDDGTVETGSHEGREGVSRERALLILGDSQAGAFTAAIDDVGISRMTDDSSIFGKYDFYSGTSMATPYVTGAAALAAAADQNAEGRDAASIVGEVLSMVNDDPPLKVNKGRDSAVNTEGTIDFAKKGQGFWLSVSSITVDPDKKQIKLKGNFDDGEELDVKYRFPYSGDEAQSVPAYAVISTSPTEIVLSDRGWINNVVDFTVSKTKGDKKKSVTKKNEYLIKGKKNYTVFGEELSEFTTNAALTTDGRLIYGAQSAGDTILYMDPSDEYFETDEIATFTKSYIKSKPNKTPVFELAQNMSKTANYDFRFGDDLVRIGNDFYVRGSFCAVTDGEGGDSGAWTQTVRGSDAGSTGTIGDSPGAAYIEEAHLFKINASTGTITKIKDAPGGTMQLTDCKLASFNGSLYLLGGIDESKDTFSKKVYCYDAAKNTWTAKADLPEGRAGGKVLQTGTMLVYTLGYSAACENLGAAPANWVFDGTKWTQKAEMLTPVDPDKMTVSRGNKEYCNVRGSVGICADGLVYIGVPVLNYGDTFVCNVSKDVYTGTNYNYTKSMDEVYELYEGEKQIAGLVVANRIVCWDEESNVIGVNKAVSSGLIKITPSIKNGKMSGTGTFMPGTKRTIKATADPGYYVTGLTAAGASNKKTVAKGMTASLTATKAVTVTAKTAKVTVTSVKSLNLKAGKSASLKAKIKQAAAAKQWKLAYKSSNKKYATVNAAGKVTAKKAGKGKTVKISIMLKGTSKTMKTVKVKVK